MFDLAYRQARECADFDPGRYQVHLLSSARILVSSGRKHEALKLVIEFRSLDSLIVLAAGTLLDDGDSTGALELIDEVDTPQAAVLRAYAYFNAGDYGRSVQACRVALETEPEQANALVLLARSYSALGVSKKSLRYALQARRVAPFRKDVRTLYVEMLIGCEDLAAKSELREILRLRCGAVGRIVYLGRTG